MRLRSTAVSSFLLALAAAACGALGEREVEYRLGEDLVGSGPVRGTEQEGEWTYRYVGGGVAKEGSYEDDKQIGHWTLYHPDGTKEQEGYFDEDGFRAGAWAYWNADASLFARGVFAAGFEEGPWTFHDERGAPHCEGVYGRGRQEGAWRYHHPDGTLAAEGVYHHGRKVGAWRYADPGDATPRLEMHPCPAGVCVANIARADGSVERAGFVEDEVQVGRWTSWHAGGGLALSGELERGVPTGTWIAASPDGSTVALGEVDEGEPDGDWHVFSAGEMRVVDADDLTQIVRDAEAAARPAAPDANAPVAARELARLDVAAWLAELVAPFPRHAVRPLAVDAASAREPAPDPKPEAPIAPAPITQIEVERAPKLFEFYAWGQPLRVGETTSDGLYGAETTTGAALRGWRGRAPGVRRFLAPDMSVLDLDRLLGEPVLLVVLRGMPGRGREVCIYCNMQVKAYAARASELSSACHVVVVYPGPVTQIAAFQEAYAQLSPGESEIPFRFVADVDEELVLELGIQADLAEPTTILLDAAGRVAWSYRGVEIEDRPTVATLLRELAELEP